MSIPPILQRVTDKGYKVFTSGTYNLNIIGVRTSTNETNTFNDWLHVVFKDDSENWVDITFKITTDPGLYWLENPSRVEGTAILVPDQYRGSHKIGLHKGQYTALTQVQKVKVYRDNNRNDVLDMNPDTIQDGYFGINIHRASATRESTQVDKWSAGCQVFADPNEYDAFISLCQRAAEKWGDTFTYTLLED